MYGEKMSLSEGVIVGTFVFIIATVLTYHYTDSRWSLALGGILGLVAGFLFSLLPPPEAWIPF